MMRPIVLILAVTTLAAGASRSQAEPPRNALRVATYNISFYRDRAGQLVDDLKAGDKQAEQIAEVIQRVRPHVLLLNEFDWDYEGEGIKTFREKYLGQSQQGLNPIAYPYMQQNRVNTGDPSPHDFDNDGQTGGPGDAYGWGRYPGQYGMVVLSQIPLDRDNIHLFQYFRWRDMPGAKFPKQEDGTNYYSDEELEVFRLSSKTMLDVSVLVPLAGGIDRFHLLCSHPTPPVFDGPENRNGLRNHDEIRLLADYIDAERGAYVKSDGGKQGGLEPGAAFVIVGDLNADPADGGSSPDNIGQLLSHPLVNATQTPSSEGAIESSQQHADLNAKHKSPAKYDTANFSKDGHANLRADYVLPSRNLKVVGSGVFWPASGDPGAEAIEATDHRLVYIDLALAASSEPTTE